jgi:histidinol-phosphate aminotransferase
MLKINGVKPFRSEANFILFKVKDSDSVYNKLLDRGVLVRNMKGILDGCLRVTIGKPEENKLFIDTLNNILGNKNIFN